MSYLSILGIESAIEGGSISLYSEGNEIDAWLGEQSVSRAEDLLPNIDRLLKRNSIALTDIDRVIVSIGPGSFTGIKIGLATVLGLRAALGVDCRGISSLDAIASLADGVRTVAALPVGRGLICIQTFETNLPTVEPTLVDRSEFNTMSFEADSRLVLHGSLFAEGRFPGAVNAGFDLASHLCRTISSGQSASPDLKPLFVERASVSPR